ncbi:CUB domain-containing protein [Ditylenchus destructor]|uniref:CUB domain-containing protein n=1 Tax=Ditylenchus destructor TaxID=166010 RepID=A0AAD4N9M9_9BILA|nr:CUB domain-containing protein [Ditylenchus destructor]
MLSLLFEIFCILALCIIYQFQSNVALQPCSDNPIELTATSHPQYVHSPYDEQNLYPPDCDCKFVLATKKPMHRIHVSVLDSELEEPLFTVCNDYCSFRDGNSSSARELVKWCGADYPRSLTSTADTLYLHFHSDSIIQKRGFNLSFVEFELPGCPPEWIADPTDAYCYKLFLYSVGIPWPEAQKACNYEKSNLLTFTGSAEYEFVSDTFSSTYSLPWIGYNDVATEGTFESTERGAPLWPERFPNFGGDHESKDCVFLDWTQKTQVDYAIDDCRSRHSFICKKRRDGSTLAYTLPAGFAREGLVTSSSMDFSVLLAVLVLLILLIILIWIGYHQYKKRKAPAQVNNLDQNQRLVTGSAAVSVLRQSQSSVKESSATNPGAEIESGVRGNRQSQYTAANTNLGYEAGEEDFGQPEVEKPADLSHWTGHEPQHPQAGTHQAGRLSPSKLSSMPRREGTMLTTTSTNPPASNASTGSRFRTRKKSFDRPHVGALDSVSAISMDEFWQK